MDAFWTLLIIISVFFFLLVILPNIIPAKPSAYKATLVQDEHISPPPTQKELDKIDAVVSKQMLDKQFVPAATVVPVNYPKKEIGACPYTKAPSTDLPLVDTPMCISVQQHDMRLASCQSK